MKAFKHSILLTIGMMMVLSIQAQKASIETASLSLRTYNKEGEKDEVKIHSLSEAKKHVDLAVANPTTSNDPKMWLMRSRTYLAMHTDKLGENGTSSLPDPNAIQVAVESMINCHKVDDKQKYSRSRDAYEAFVRIAVSAQNIAIGEYNKKNYDRSIQYYQLTRDLIPYDDESLLKRQNITDDGLLNNIAYTAKAAEQYTLAKEKYNELIERSYNDPWIYLELYDIYLNVDNDTNMSIITIDKGRNFFPDNANLKYQQIFIYSVSGRGNELLKILNDNIELDPYNAENYVLRGKLNRNLETKARNESKIEDANKYNAAAIEDFSKAIEYNDQNLEAHNEIGELYYLRGAEVLEQANQLNFNETTKFEELNAEAKEYFNKSIPSWEAIYTYSTDEKESGKAAQFLLQMYLKTEQMDKYKELKAELQ